ncbi:outer membrane protein assembly factor BamA [bacterium]|nr:outer membrane protein assembly factor BamA [bacterium]
MINFFKTKIISAPLSIFMVLSLLTGNLYILPVYAQKNEDVIQKIKIIGLKSLTEEYVINKIRSREGRYFYPSVVKADIKDLYATGNFSMIDFETEKQTDGITLTITLQEKPILTEIIFVGNKKIKKNALKKAVSSKVGDPADEGKIKQDILAITSKYIEKGYPQVEVDYRLDIKEDTNEAALKIIIDEGRQLKVKKISFEGVKAFKPKMLKRIMKTKTESIWPLNVLLKTGILNEEQFAEDLNQLQNFYHYKGYLDAKIKNVKRNVTPEKNKIELIIIIEEGPTYQVGSIDILGNTLFPTKSLEELVISKPNTLYSPEKLTKDTQAIKKFYMNRGYIEVRIINKVLFSPKSEKMDITFSLVEGSLYHVNKINIKGNYKTKDKVIRRELLINPGEIFNGEKIKISQKRLSNLGFFDKIDISISDADDPAKKNLTFNVNEKKTGSLSFGAGFSSIDSLVGFAEISQSNFDLFNFKNFQGAGQKFRIRFEGGSKRVNFLLSFVEPYFLDKKLMFGFDAFVDKNDYFSDDYDEERVGVNFRLGKSISMFNRGEVILTLENIDIKVDHGASPELQKEKGSYDVAAVSFKFTRDTRDKIVFPSKGGKTVAVLKLSGGTENYVRFDLTNSLYFAPFSMFPKHILHLKNGLGFTGSFSGGRVPIFDRMFLGGSNTVRGFEYREISPKDVYDEPLGAKHMSFFSCEYLFPIVERVKGALFIDTGNVADNLSDILFDSNVGAGFGVRLNLPIGPIKLDYGFPIITNDLTKDDAKPRFHFNMGTSF